MLRLGRQRFIGLQLIGQFAFVPCPAGYIPRVRRHGSLMRFEALSSRLHILGSSLRSC